MVEVLVGVFSFLISPGVFWGSYYALPRLKRRYSAKNIRQVEVVQGQAREVKQIDATESPVRESLKHSEEYKKKRSELVAVLDFYAKEYRELSKSARYEASYSLTVLRAQQQKLETFAKDYSIAEDVRESMKNVSGIFVDMADSDDESQYREYEKKYLNILEILVRFLDKGMYYSLKEHPELWDDAEAKIAKIDKYVRNFQNTVIEDLQSFNEKKFDDVLAIYIPVDEEEQVKEEHNTLDTLSEEFAKWNKVDPDEPKVESGNINSYMYNIQYRFDKETEELDEEYDNEDEVLEKNLHAIDEEFHKGFDVLHSRVSF